MASNGTKRITSLALAQCERVRGRKRARKRSVSIPPESRCPAYAAKRERGPEMSEQEPCLVCGWNYEPNGSLFCDECESESEGVKVLSL